MRGILPPMAFLLSILLLSAGNAHAATTLGDDWDIREYFQKYLEAKKDNPPARETASFLEKHPEIRYDEIIFIGVKVKR